MRRKIRVLEVLRGAIYPLLAPELKTKRQTLAVTSLFTINLRKIRGSYSPMVVL